jgi:hypothetical protein
VGQPIVVFESPLHSCDRNDIPDAPARAIRDASGQIQLYASHFVNRRLSGRSLYELQHPCDVAFTGRHDSQPQAYDDYGWLTSFFTEDGRTVYALIHNEFHGAERPELCQSKVPAQCWENALTAAQSTDGGRFFQRVAGSSGLVAALPLPFTGKRERQTGYFNPTNIVKLGSFYYVMAAMIDPIMQRAGICVMRTPNIANPAEWRGWDGKDFTIHFVDPYGNSHAEPTNNVCSPLTDNNLFFGVTSLSYNESSKTFIAVMRFNHWDRARHGELPGIYASASIDLINWSRPVLILSDQQAATEQGDQKQVEYYPSLLDPEAADRNFQTISDYPLLFTIQMSKSRPENERRLVARQIEFNLERSH